MPSTERRHPAGRFRRRAIRVAGAALFGSMFWLMAVTGAPALGVMHAVVAAHAPRAEASGSTSTNRSGHSRDHKEGPVAVVVSVIGVIAVVVFIVGLGSLSVRRRTRSGPPTRGPDRGGRPGSGRGPFDQWFRPRE